MDGSDGQSGFMARFGEASKILPICAVLMTVVVLYVNYVFLHCFRLLQYEIPAQIQKLEDISRGTIEMATFHFLTGMMLYCMARCVLTRPGVVPDGKGWELRADDEDDAEAGDGETRGANLVEKKHTGERRHCKWCLKYKPDRCHHCRICNVCVLRMDHHCPWVYNCIGFRNHKYFFLLITYAVADLIVITFTMFDSVWWSTRVDVSVGTMVGLMIAETISAFLMVLMTCFVCFHIWLMTKAMTTVEFCEKSLKKASYNSSVYSVGLYGNICAILGPNPVFWLLPISLPGGDGLTWTPASKEEAAKGQSSSSGRDDSGSRASLIEQKHGRRDSEQASSRRESEQTETAPAVPAAGAGGDEPAPARGSRGARGRREGNSRSKPEG